MIDIKIVFAILFIHWIADFVLQTDKQAKGKSKNWGDLLSHTGVYSTVWAFASLFIIGYTDNTLTANQYIVYSLLFAGITFVAHTVTDYFTSRLNSKLYAANKVHYFFVSIGFDQILHYVQLFLTYQFIINSL